MVVLTILAILAVGLATAVGIHVLRREYFPLLSELERNQGLEDALRELPLSGGQEEKEVEP